MELGHRGGVGRGLIGGRGLAGACDMIPVPGGFGGDGQSVASGWGIDGDPLDDDLSGAVGAGNMEAIWRSCLARPAEEDGAPPCPGTSEGREHGHEEYRRRLGARDGGTVGACRAGGEGVRVRVRAPVRSATDGPTRSGDPRLMQKGWAQRVKDGFEQPGAPVVSRGNATPTSTSPRRRGQGTSPHAPRRVDVERVLVESRFGHPARVRSGRMRAPGHRRYRAGASGGSCARPERSGGGAKRVDSACGFRPRAITDSGGNRSLIPVEIDSRRRN